MENGKSQQPITHRCVKLVVCRVYLVLQVQSAVLLLTLVCIGPCPPSSVPTLWLESHAHEPDCARTPCEVYSNRAAVESSR